MSVCCSPRVTRTTSCARTWRTISPTWSCGGCRVCKRPAVLLLNATERLALALLLDRYGMQLTLVAPGEGIPASYWGHSEAGLKGARLYARLDTPVHSVLHEASHYICMTAERRAGLARDARGPALQGAGEGCPQGVL